MRYSILVFGLVSLLALPSAVADLISYETPDGKIVSTDKASNVPANAKGVERSITDGTKRDRSTSDDAPAKPNERFRITSIDTNVTERNSSWAKYSYVLMLQNLSDEPLVGQVEVQWLDSDGFVIVDKTLYSVAVPVQQTRTFQGYQLIDADVARNVSSINASVTLN